MEEFNQSQIVRIDLNCIEEVRKLAKIPRQNVLFCEGVEKINMNSSGTKLRILAITDQSIAYFTNEQKPTKKISYGWTSIHSYSSVKEKQEIDMIFANGPFKFISPKWQEIEKIIFDVLKHVLAADEWNALQIDADKRYHIPRYTLPSASGVYSRYLSMLMQMHKKSPKSIERQFIKYVATYNKTFKLEADPDLPDIFILIGDALKPFTRLESIILPCFTDGAINLYNDLAQILIQHSPIQHISIGNTPNEQFLAFCDSLKTSQVTGLTFHDMNMEKDHLTILQESLVNIPFRSLSFQNAFDSSQFDFFYQEFLTGYITSHLIMLNLDKTVGIDIDKVINDLPIINSLSFSYCNVDVAETLIKIGKANLPHLRLLNLSGNFGQTVFDLNEIKIPNELARFDLNDVKWAPGVLPSFIEYITSTKREKGLRLYLERATFLTNTEISDKVNNQFSKNSGDLDVTIDIMVDENGNIANIEDFENNNDEDNISKNKTQKIEDDKKSKKNKNDKKQENEDEQTGQTKEKRQQIRKSIWSFPDWSRIDDILDSALYYPLVELGWSGNPVSSSLLSFLEKNESLTTLFLSDSFDPDDKNSLALFASHVNNLQSLKNLVIKGLEQCELGPSLFPLLSSLQNNQSISLLDVSDQCIGDEGINLIAKILEKNNILQVVTFDGSLFNEKESLINLLIVSDQRQRSIKISYPFNDIQQKIKDHIITADDTSIFKQKLSDLRHFVPGISKPSMTIDDDFKKGLGKKQRKVRTGSMMIQTQKNLKRPLNSNNNNNINGKTNPKIPSHLSVKIKDDINIGDAIRESELSVFDKPFDFFISDFSDDFPLYVGDTFLKEYQINLQSLENEHLLKKKKNELVSKSVPKNISDISKDSKTKKHKTPKIVFLNSPEEFEELKKNIQQEFQYEQNNYYNVDDQNEIPEFNRNNQNENHTSIIFKNFENEEEEIIENNEKEIELDNLYEEEGFSKPNYYPTLQMVTPSDDSEYIESINQKCEFTKLVNALLTSK